MGHEIEHEIEHEIPFKMVIMTNARPFLTLEYILDFLGLETTEDALGGEIAVFSAERWGRRSRGDVIECTTPFHGAQVEKAEPGVESCPS